MPCFQIASKRAADAAAKEEKRKTAEAEAEADVSGVGSGSSGADAKKRKIMVRFSYGSARLYNNPKLLRSILGSTHTSRPPRSQRPLPHLRCQWCVTANSPSVERALPGS